ncbi:MAG TPA: thiamine pyrophosphate-dependent dehydrogenase E1 component subunit alpha [Candidatus Omnitrophota bacterium]|nr:thiamine pyrophosphate-dependent dehydrogenase E1 component subunit alpha [Candidatus Omnitrophota bacterium]HSA30235.1 thiamine pyrophosphate-dependent dehydrogenase E1 component subunit alpha [Candidatus Omnitrophota bacterium]
MNIMGRADDKVLEGILKTMLTIRLFEERVAEMAARKEVRCPVHLYVGQEAIASAVCANLNREDYVFSTHRSHGHYIAKQGDLNSLMAEIHGKEAGCSKGYGGSMHVVDVNAGFMGSSAIVAGTIPIAAGAALTSFLTKNNSVVSVAFFGDGATDEGVFYETVNFAALYKLPILFVCENNLFSTHLPDFKRQSNTKVYERVKNFKIRTRRINGNDPIKIYNASKWLIERIKRGEGPALLECMTYRWLAHVGHMEDLDVGHRKKEDVEFWKKKCPIKFLKRVLFRRGKISERQYEDMKKGVEAEIERAVSFAQQSPLPLAKTEKAAF